MMHCGSSDERGYKVCSKKLCSDNMSCVVLSSLRTLLQDEVINIISAPRMIAFNLFTTERLVRR